MRVGVDCLLEESVEEHSSGARALPTSLVIRKPGPKLLVGPRVVDPAYWVSARRHSPNPTALKQRCRTYVRSYTIVIRLNPECKLSTLDFRATAEVATPTGALPEPFGRAAGSIRRSQTACDQAKHEWGSRDLNPGPTDYESVALTS